MKHNSTLSLLKYELLNLMGGFFTPFFGIVFPVVMGLLFTSIIPAQVAPDYVKQVTTSIAITMSLMIPLSIMLVSFPSAYSQEVEQNIIFRLELFQISSKQILVIKIIANYLIMTLSLIFYIVVLFIFKGNDLILPAATSALIYLLSFYVIATAYFIFSFSVSNIFKKFGITYAITMAFYFITFFFSGLFGIQPNELPGVLSSISKFFPTSFITTDFGRYWDVGFSGYNFAPFIQSLIFVLALAGITFFISLYKNRRRI